MRGGSGNPDQRAIDERSFLPGRRSSGTDERSAVSSAWSGSRIAVVVAGTVLAAAILQVLIRIAVGGADLSHGLADDFLRDLLAATSWVPVGAGVVWLARRFPPRRGALVVPALVHLSGIGVAALAVNVLIAAAWWVTRLLPDAAGFGETVLAGAVGHIHVNALIYILLLAVATRIRPPRTGRPGADAARPQETADRRLAVSQGNRTRLVPLPQVDWIEAAGDYASVHVGDRSYLLSERMYALETRLRKLGFARVHRSAIVNLARVIEVRSESGGNGTLLLKGGAEVPLSRRRKDAIEARLGIGGSAPRR